jgi:hypothetical protein
LSKFVLNDFAVGKIDRSRHMAVGIQRWRPYVQQNEIGSGTQTLVHIPAVGLESEFRGEVRLGD